MRQVVLDTETTGLNAKLGDRVIEIGCLELLNRRPTGNHFHRYLNPERASEEGAVKVHGISDEFLLDKPRFREIASEFIEYLHGALLDAELLAEAYLAMTRGQESLVMELEPVPAAAESAGGVPSERAKVTVLAAGEEELAEHGALLQGIQVESKGKCVWLKLEGEGEGEGAGPAPGPGAG